MLRDVSLDQEVVTVHDDCDQVVDLFTPYGQANIKQTDEYVKNLITFKLKTAESCSVKKLL